MRSHYIPTSMEKAMASHSSTLAWKIPWMEEPGRLQPMGSLRVGHDWVTSLSVFTFMHWRRKWQISHSSVLAWRIPGTVGPGGLPSMGSHRVGHDWSDLAAAAAAWIPVYVLFILWTCLYMCYILYTCHILNTVSDYISRILVNKYLFIKRMKIGQNYVCFSASLNH